MLERIKATAITPAAGIHGKSLLVGLLASGTIARGRTRASCLGVCRFGLFTTRSGLAAVIGDVKTAPFEDYPGAGPDQSAQLAGLAALFAFLQRFGGHALEGLEDRAAGRTLIIVCRHFATSVTRVTAVFHRGPVI